MAVPKKYEHINFKPPQNVADAANRGLEYRRRSGKGGLSSQEAGKAGIGSGVQRAVNLKNKNNISPDTFKMMRGFFSRHKKNKSIAPENRETPWEDAGHVAWLLWGGDPGKKWVDKIIKQMEEADEKEKKEKEKKEKTAEVTRFRKKTYRRRDRMESPFGVHPKDLRRLREEELIEERKNASARVATRWLQASASRVALMYVKSENIPTNEKLWEKVIKLTKGEIKSLKHNGKTVNGPNDGDGFQRYPSAYANGWASKVYKDLGGKWKKGKKAKGKAKKDVGHGGLDEWFSGHDGGKGDATWGDWVAISPVKKTIKDEEGNEKKYEPGDIVGPCGISEEKGWKEVTNNGNNPLKCMPRNKAYDVPKKERAELAKEKMKAEKGSKGKKPVRTPTFSKDKDKKKEKKEKKKASSKRIANRYLEKQLNQRVLDISRKLEAGIKSVDVLVSEEGTVGFDWKVLATLVKDGLSAQIIYEYFDGASLEIKINGRTIYKKQKLRYNLPWEDYVVMVLEKFGF